MEMEHGKVVLEWLFVSTDVELTFYNAVVVVNCRKKEHEIQFNHLIFTLDNLYKYE